MIQRTPDVLAAAEFCGASVYKSTSPSVAHATVEVLGFDTKAFDSHGFHSGSSGRLVVPSGRSGKYLVVGIVQYAANGTGNRRARVSKNGTLIAQSSHEATSTAAEVSAVEVACLVDLAPGDYVELSAYQTSGGALAVNGGSAATQFSMTYLGPTVLPKLGGGLSLIGHKHHVSASAPVTTSTTFVDVDPTNFVVSFIAPPSGTVLVRLTASQYAAAAPTTQYWSLREGSTDIQSMIASETPVVNVISTPSKVFKVSGLTPGQQYTYKWGWRTSSSTATFYSIANGGGATMEVWSVQ